LKKSCSWRFLVLVETIGLCPADGGQEVGHGLADARARLDEQVLALVEGLRDQLDHPHLLRPDLVACDALLEHAARPERGSQLLHLDGLRGRAVARVALAACIAGAVEQLAVAGEGAAIARGRHVEDARHPPLLGFEEQASSRPRRPRRDHRHRRDDLERQRVQPRHQPIPQDDEHPRVVQRAVTLADLELQLGDQRVEIVVWEGRPENAGELEGVEHRVPEGAVGLGGEELALERRVVRHHHVVTDEAQEVRQHDVARTGPTQVGVADARQLRDRQRQCLARVRKLGKLLDRLAAGDPNRGELGTAANSMISDACSSSPVVSRSMNTSGRGLPIADCRLPIARTPQAPILVPMLQRRDGAGDAPASVPGITTPPRSRLGEGLALPQASRLKPSPCPPAGRRS